MFDVCWCRWDSDGLEMDLVRVVLELLDCVNVVEGELEVWRQVVGSHVVIGRAGDDVGVDLV